MSSDTSWSPVYVGMDCVAKRVWSLASAKPSASDVVPFRMLAFVPECPTGTQRPAVEDSTHPRDRRCSKSHPPQFMPQDIPTMVTRTNHLCTTSVSADSKHGTKVGSVNRCTRGKVEEVATRCVGPSCEIGTVTCTIVASSRDCAWRKRPAATRDALDFGSQERVGDSDWRSNVRCRVHCDLHLYYTEVGCQNCFSKAMGSNAMYRLDLLHCRQKPWACHPFQKMVRHLAEPLDGEPIGGASASLSKLTKIELDVITRSVGNSRVPRRWQSWTVGGSLLR